MHEYTKYFHSKTLYQSISWFSWFFVDFSRCFSNFVYTWSWPSSSAQLVHKDHSSTIFVEQVWTCFLSIRLFWQQGLVSLRSNFKYYQFCPPQFLAEKSVFPDNDNRAVEMPCNCVRQYINVFSVDFLMTVFRLHGSFWLKLHWHPLLHVVCKQQ